MYALEVRSGNWKANDIFPSMNTARCNHSSCVVKGAIYVVAGFTTNYNMISSIEMLHLRLNEGQNFAFISKTWSKI